MSKKIKDFSEKLKGFRLKVKWQSVVGFLIVVLFVGASVLFNGEVLAKFYRTTGGTGFSYGYGYGYDAGWGYGYGYHQSENKPEYGYLMSRRLPASTVTTIGANSAQMSVIMGTQTNSYRGDVKVQYGIGSGSYTNTVNYTGSYLTSHTVSLTGLNCATTYYYRVTGKDIGGNEWQEAEKSFNTSACAGAGPGGGGAAPPTEEEEEVVETVVGEGAVTPEDGGTVSGTSAEGGSATIEVPAGAVSNDTEITVTPIGTAESLTGDPPAGSFMVGGYVYNFTAVSDGEAVTTFDEDVTLTFTYTDEQVAGLDESTITIYYWDADAREWVPLPTTVDPDTNTVTTTVNHLTYFALIGEEKEKAPKEMTVEELQAKIAEILEQLAILKAQLAKMKGVAVYEGVPAGFEFEANLSYGATSDDVKYLQIILKEEIGPPTYPEDVPATGWFGPITKASVIEFQEKYQEDVLGPWGLTAGTGFVGKTTRAKLNELLGVE